MNHKLHDHIIIREEFDDWAILFDPDTANGYALDPVGVAICRQLDGVKTVAEITEVIREQFDEVSDEVDTHCADFVRQLLDENLAA
ncbi:MAG: PqqD family peptide modification chaperone [Negativicutes bacterium]|jgi:SynChlorMet cassette protein ScmD